MQLPGRIFSGSLSAKSYPYRSNFTPYARNPTPSNYFLQELDSPRSAAQAATVTLLLWLFIRLTLQRFRIPAHYLGPTPSLKRLQWGKKDGIGCDSNSQNINQVMAQKCTHKGCEKLFTDPEEDCNYHPGAPIFHEGQKGVLSAVFPLLPLSTTNIRLPYRVAML